MITEGILLGYLYQGEGDHFAPYLHLNPPQCWILVTYFPIQYSGHLSQRGSMKLNMCGIFLRSSGLSWHHWLDNGNVRDLSWFRTNEMQTLWSAKLSSNCYYQMSKEFIKAAVLGCCAAFIFSTEQVKGFSISELILNGYRPEGLTDSNS